MILEGIRNIIFDFGCVIVNLDKHKCIEALDAIEAHEISSYVDECRQTDMFQELELGTIGVGEFCAEVRRKAPGCTATDRQIAEAWGALLTDIPLRRLRRLEHLHGRYRLYLLSNSNPVHWEKSAERFFPLAGHAPEYYFDQMFISYKMGMTKPDRRIFETLLRQTGIEPAETLFVDDSMANCRMAESMGIRTLHVAHGDEWAAPLGVDGITD